MASSIINTNIAATRTHNVYNRNNEFMNAAMTRVATGMRINSAKDGASTWAISEKMRERMRANDQANQNVQNDTAMLKVAQGGIGNTIDILTTLKERAINAANDSNLNTDRSRIAAEVYQLVEQINDNALKVKFNGRTLLNGGIGDDTTGTFTPVAESGNTTSAGSATSTPVTMNTSGTEATAAVYKSAVVAATSFKGWGGPSATGNAANGATTTRLVDLVNSSGNITNAAVTDADRMFNVGDVVTLSFTVDGQKQENTFTVDAYSTITDLLNGGLNGKGVKTVWGGATSLTDSANNKTYTTNTTTHAATTTEVKSAANEFVVYGDKGKVVSDVTLSISGEGEDVGRQAFLDKFALTSTHFYYTEETPTVSSDALTFYVGGEANFGIDVTINAMNSTGLGLGDSETFAKSFLTKSDAESAIAKIDAALNTALNEQTRLGAFEARLGYTSDNLITMNENLEAADSAMRDADIAKEMTSYMKYAVLSQASQYMLAQAGQNAYQVLNLLQQ